MKTYSICRRIKLQPTDGFESAPREKLTEWREECCEKALQMKTMDQSVICYCYADADKIVLSGHRSESKVRGKIPDY